MDKNNENNQILDDKSQNTQENQIFQKTKQSILGIDGGESEDDREWKKAKWTIHELLHIKIADIIDNCDELQETYKIIDAWLYFLEEDPERFIEKSIEDIEFFQFTLKDLMEAREELFTKIEDIQNKYEEEEEVEKEEEDEDDSSIFSDIFSLGTDGKKEQKPNNQKKKVSNSKNARKNTEESDNLNDNIKDGKLNNKTEDYNIDSENNDTFKVSQIIPIPNPNPPAIDEQNELDGNQNYKNNETDQNKSGLDSQNFSFSQMKIKNSSKIDLEIEIQISRNRMLPLHKTLLDKGKEFKDIMVGQGPLGGGEDVKNIYDELQQIFDIIYDKYDDLKANQPDYEKWLDGVNEMSKKLYPHTSECDFQAKKPSF